MPIRPTRSDQAAGTPPIGLLGATPSTVMTKMACGSMVSLRDASFRGLRPLRRKGLRCAPMNTEASGLRALAAIHPQFVLFFLGKAYMAFPFRDGGATGGLPWRS